MLKFRLDTCDVMSRFVEDIDYSLKLRVNINRFNGHGRKGNLSLKKAGAITNC